MEKVKLGKITTKLQSGDGIKASEIYEDGVYPVFGGNGIRGYTNSYNQDGEYFFIGRQGAKCGNVHYNIGRAYMTEHAVVGCPKDGYDAIYLSYKLSLLNLGKLQGQSAQPGLAVGTLSDVELEVPDALEQHCIGGFLLELDKKISLNIRINAELEAMAKQLYDYWFVQFDFPDENGRPYKSSDGKMVWNEKLKREIPDGWEVKNLFYIAKFTNGIACQNYRPTDENKLPVIKIREMHDGWSNETEYATKNIPESVKVQNEDVLFSWSASLEVMLWCWGEGALNQHIFKVTSNNDYPRSFYYYQILNYVGIFKKIAEARKTTMGHITQDHLEQSTIIIPPNLDLPNRLEEKLMPIMNQMVKLNEEKTYLTHLRDSLLPMLMNGQVTIE